MGTRSRFSSPLFDTSGWKSPTQHVHIYPNFWSRSPHYIILLCIPNPEPHPWSVRIPPTINSLFTNTTRCRWIRRIFFLFLPCQTSQLYTVHLSHTPPSTFPPAFISILDPNRGIDTSCYPRTNHLSLVLPYQTRLSRTSTRRIARCAENGTRGLRTPKQGKLLSSYVISPV